MQTTTRLDWFRALIGKSIAEHSLSPYGRWLAGTLQHVDHGELTLHHVVREEMTNPVGLLHGGVTAGIIDDAMGMLFFTLGLEHFYPTVNLAIDYLAGARAGDTVITHVQVTRQGKTLINMKATVHLPDGKIIAQASSNLVVSGIKMGV